MVTHGIAGGAFGEIHLVYGPDKQGAQGRQGRQGRQGTEPTLTYKVIKAFSFKGKGSQVVKRKSLYRETTILKSELSHPNINKFIAHAYYNEAGYIMMEYINGVTVETIINLVAGEGLRLTGKAGYRVNSLYFYKITDGLLSAMEYLHSKNIFHRDMGTQNIMICGDSKDKSMPLMAKVIDLGSGCMHGKDGDKGYASCTNLVDAGASPFSWPYGRLDGRPPTHRELECNDMWTLGNVLYNIAYGMDFNELSTHKGLGGGPVGQYRLKGKGGHPTPPDFTKHIMTQQEEEGGGPAEVLATYVNYVMGVERDPVYDFDPQYASDIHDTIRLLLARNEGTCVSAREMIEYVKEVWHNNNKMFGILRQKKIPYKHCDMPCEDPVNNYYEERCTACAHCEWNAAPGKPGANGYKIRCRAKEPLPPAPAQLCPTGIWNPYRQVCENVADMDYKIVKDRYAILFTDGATVSGKVLRDRIIGKSHEYTKRIPMINLASMAQVEHLLGIFQHHPLKTPPSSNTYMEYMRTRKPPKTEFGPGKQSRLSKLRKHVARESDKKSRQEYGQAGEDWEPDTSKGL